jgi:hypothetical protein
LFAVDVAGEQSNAAGSTSVSPRNCDFRRALDIWHHPSHTLCLAIYLNRLFSKRRGGGAAPTRSRRQSGPGGCGRARPAGGNAPAADASPTACTRASEARSLAHLPTHNNSFVTQIGFNRSAANGF